MPLNETCLIDVDTANALRLLVDKLGLKVPKGKMAFLCPDCGKPVKPHDAGGDHAAHFEHLRRNKKCSLSLPSRR